jgi:hypothetical protein
LGALSFLLNRFNGFPERETVETVEEVEGGSADPWMNPGVNKNAVPALRSNSVKESGARGRGLRSSLDRIAPRSIALVLALTGGALAQSPTFRPPERLTDGSLPFRLSRTPNSIAAFDSRRTLHLVYWAGRLATTPDRPSFIFHQSWTPLEGWSAPVVVDDSFAGVDRLGGRHPTLAVGADDALWVAWHDHRNSTPPNWIDNLEIYIDSMPPGGAFSADDVRLTITSGAGAGDNGFTPKLALHPSGRLSLSWYDFHNDGEISDLFMMNSGPDGRLAPTSTVNDHRLTDLTARGGSPAFTVQDMAVDANETRHLVWAGGAGAGVDLYYASVPLGETVATPQIIDAGGTDFFDPPRVAVAPDGDVWIAYGDDSTETGNEEVVLLRRLGGVGAFQKYVVVQGPGRNFAPDVEIDAVGRVHLVWIEEGAETHVNYGLFSPSAARSIERVRITDRSATWSRPSLALDPGGAHVLAVFEESLGQASGDIWFATTWPLDPRNAVRRAHWSRYR